MIPLIASLIATIDNVIHLSLSVSRYAEFVKVLSNKKLRDYQCVEDVVKKKKVTLLCQNGKKKTYRIKVVKSCKCKKITNVHNRTSRKTKKRRKKNKRRKRRKGERRRDRKNKSSKGS